MGKILALPFALGLLASLPVHAATSDRLAAEKRSSPSTMPTRHQPGQYQQQFGLSARTRNAQRLANRLGTRPNPEPSVTVQRY